MVLTLTRVEKVDNVHIPVNVIAVSRREIHRGSVVV